MIDVEEVVDGTTNEQVLAIIDAWQQPEIRWPKGTEFLPPKRSKLWSSPTAIAKLPNGHWYELLLERNDEKDPRETPPVLYAFMIDERTGEVFAYPRIANMSQGIGLERLMATSIVPEETKALHHGAGLGLEPRYKVGTLGRVLYARTRTVIDGWE